MKILVTGSAGFIGFHLCRRLLSEGHEVVGLDCINDYYDIRVKYGRLEQCGIDSSLFHNEQGFCKTLESSSYPSFRFVRIDISNKDHLEQFFSTEEENRPFDVVCNLAAQAGVRYSLENPGAYIQSNIVGFTNILELCRHHSVGHLVYASSSSVYGLNTEMPFSVSDNVDHPISLYAASKKSNELMAHSYSYLYGLPTTGLRFFTVYGPWGRPDMALFLFTKAILEGKPLKVFNHGKMKRDFTYIDDIVDGIVRVMHKTPQTSPDWDASKGDGSNSSAPYKVYNIGNGQAVQLMDFVREVEKALGQKAELEYLPMQAGDVPATWSDTRSLQRDTGYKPSVSAAQGVQKFVSWYREFYQV